MNHVNKKLFRPRPSALLVGLVLGSCTPALHAEIAATHIYHNHMPNFWPYYDVSQYDATPVGEPIRYAYDGQVIALKQNPPENYTFYVPDIVNFYNEYAGVIMPHDGLLEDNRYYDNNTKAGAYQSWPANTAKLNNATHPQSQTHVTMSASVINNVQSFTELATPFKDMSYESGWGQAWKDSQQSTKTSNGFNALDTIHFTGHHSMGPLVGNDYFLKDLIYHNVTLAQPYFLGDSFKSSKGFFPTELGFSERIIPVLTKLGIEWSVLGDVHYSRTLKDYPYLNDPGVDTLTSPPNRADLQNESDVGEWVAYHMRGEEQWTHNKFPFAAIPHWVQYIDPETGEAHQVAGIPVEQASSWEEGYQGSVAFDWVTSESAYKSDDIPDPLPKQLPEFVEAAGERTMYFVVAHDGDNSSGRAGSSTTWENSGKVTYAQAGVTGKGVDEYLHDHPIPADDIVHVQDGSWIDTRDSSADPTWYHWHIPMGVWDTQMGDFNSVNGTDYTASRKHMVSMELGYHYLERNFALLQAAQNYAKTAEQIWLDDNPNYWQPTTALDHEVTYEGNQLNPWMLSYPVKGDAENNYAGGANPAELGWYFLLASIDSGFGYYDENTDDGVKPTISFNQSLYFTTPYVEANLAKDKTGPSVWWPQRYPYNPGSVNNGKAEGWAKLYTDTKFAIYTYAYDVSGIEDIKLKVRVHKHKSADPKDKTYQLYEPKTHAADPLVDPTRVGEWQSFAMLERDLGPDINGVEWQPSGKAVFEVVPAQKIGNLFYTYIDQYQDQLLDYYIEATDSKGNVSKSEIQQVYVGAGQYKMEDGKQVEDVNGNIAGVNVFFSDDYVHGNARPLAKIAVQPSDLDLDNIPAGTQLTLSAADSSDSDGSIASYSWSNGETTEAISVTINQSTSISLTVTDNQGSRATTSVKLRLQGDTASKVCAKLSFAKPYVHYWNDEVEGEGSSWPGVAMSETEADSGIYCVEFDSEINTTHLIFNDKGASQTARLAFDDTRPCYIDGAFSSMDKCTSAVLITPPEDEAPTANIHVSETTVTAGSTVTLDASGSSDDNDQLTFSWSSGESSAEISVVVTQTTTFELTVTDSKGQTDSASVTITAVPVGSNLPPLAKISASSVLVDSGETVQLSAASSSDPEGLPLSYLWSSGETTQSISKQLTASEKVSLTVTDSEGQQSSASVQLNVKPIVTPDELKAVISNVPAAADIEAGMTVELSAASSEGEVVNYHWEVSKVTLADPSSADISFTLEQSVAVKLTVTDAEGKASTEQVEIALEFDSSTQDSSTTSSTTSSSGSFSWVVLLLLPLVIRRRRQYP